MSQPIRRSPRRSARRSRAWFAGNAFRCNSATCRSPGRPRFGRGRFPQGPFVSVACTRRGRTFSTTGKDASMKSKAVVAVLGLAAATLALPAAAQMNMSAAYVGGALGQSNFKADCSGLNCDKKDTSFRIFGGYQFTPNIAAELGYTDLGKLKADFPPFGSGDISATAWDLSGVFSWPIGQFGVFGRLGVARVEAKPGGIFVGDSETKTGLTWGLGGQYDFNRNLGLRVEFQRFRADAGGGDTADIDNLSLGVLWRFK